MINKMPKSASTAKIMRAGEYGFGFRSNMVGLFLDENEGANEKFFRQITFS